MTRPSEKHLDDAELDALVLSPISERDSRQASGSALSEAQRHVESCEDCSRRVRMHRDAQGKLDRLGPLNHVFGSERCSQASLNWMQVATGLLPEARTKELMNHAAQCDDCGPLLRKADETIADETTPSEERLLSELESAQQHWQQQLAARLQSSVNLHLRTHERIPRRKGVVLHPRLAFAMATVSAIAFVSGWLGIRSLHSPSAEQLLGQAYTERRTIEVRIPGAKFAPMRVERGVGGSSLDKPPSLLKAESLIAEKLRKNPNDPNWLQAKARADLLDGNYDSAIKSLTLALQTQPESVPLLTDLASAYFGRAKATDRQIDYGNAIEFLGKALTKSPDDSVALFNRAVISEHAFLYTQAIEDWEHYLRVAPDGGWADEARQRLAALRDKLQQHEHVLAEPLLSQSALAKADYDNPIIRDQIRHRIEEYTHTAVVDWLPKAYPAKAESSRDSDAKSAVTVLARITSKDVEDPWLANLISDSTPRTFPSAVAALAQSVLAGDRGDFMASEALAAQAERAFDFAGNIAGKMRSRYQRVYALHLAQDGPKCLRVADGLAAQVANLRYRWLKVQALLDEGTCDWLVGNLGRARQKYQAALVDASSSHYPSIYLRAINHMAGIDSACGDEPSSWHQAHIGLARYWSGETSRMQAYNLYFVLHEVADWTHQPYLDVAVWRQAVATIDSTSDIVLRATAHSYLGNAAVAANMPDLAKLELQESAHIFAAAPQTRATGIARIEAETRLANLEVLQGQAKRAYERLAALQPEVSSISDNLLALIFYRTLGEAQFQRGAFGEADVALRGAIALTELNLSSLRSREFRERWSQEAGEAVRTLVNLKLRQGDYQRALEIWEWYRGSAVRSSREDSKESVLSPSQIAAGPPLPDLHEVASQLPTLTQQTFVSYVVLREGVELWAYDNRKISSYWITIPVGELRALVNRFQNMCSDPNSDIDSLQRVARRLYQLLIAPMEEILSSDRTLLVETDDALISLPFEALVDSEGHYLAERSSISYSLGLYYRNTLRPETVLSIESPILAVAVPTAEIAQDDAALPLPDVDEEARAIVKRFRFPTLLQGRDATVGALLKHLSNATIFHFAGHAVAAPGRAGLLLSNGLFDADLVRPAQLSKVQLAVLSACDTDRGARDATSDPESLVSALLRAGVPHVIASRWAIDSGTTRSLMEIFYPAVLSGKSVSTALHESVLALKARPGMYHPYYWSAFHAFGRG